MGRAAELEEQRLRRRRRWFLLMLGALAALLLWYLVSDWLKTDEDRILETLNGLAAAVEDEHPGNFIALISESYRDRAGNTRQDLRRMVSGYLLQRRKGGLTCLVVEDSIGIAPDRQSATVLLRAAVYEGVAVGVGPPGRGQAWDMEVGLRNEDGQWRVVSHTRRSFSASDLWRVLFGE